MPKDNMDEDLRSYAESRASAQADLNRVIGKSVTAALEVFDRGTESAEEAFYCLQTAEAAERLRVAMKKADGGL